MTSPLTSRSACRFATILAALLATTVPLAADASTVRWPLFDSPIKVRPSTEAELALRANPNLEASDTQFGETIWKTPDGNMWQAPDPFIPFEPTEPFVPPIFHRPFHDDSRVPGGVPLTIATSLVDYARSLEFHLDLRREGSEISIDAYRMRNYFTTFEHRGLEDTGKSLLQVIGSLTPGHYGVTVHTHMVTLGPGNDVDFEDFRADPLGYVLPSGAALSINVARGEFDVVPEPGTGVLAIGLTGACSAALRRGGGARRWLGECC